MPPRTGRPRSENPHRNVVPIRLTDEQHAAIKAAADLDGIAVGEYIRRHAVASARTKLAKAAAAARRSR